jgi:hypothetical protein
MAIAEHNFTINVDTERTLSDCVLSDVHGPNNRRRGAAHSAADAISTKAIYISTMQSIAMIIKPEQSLCDNSSLAVVCIQRYDNGTTGGGDSDAKRN